MQKATEHCTKQKEVYVPIHGLKIETVSATAETAELVARADICSPDERELKVELVIRDPLGAEAVRITKTLHSNQGVQTVGFSAQIQEPKLWSCETPELYSAE